VLGCRVRCCGTAACFPWAPSVLGLLRQRTTVVRNHLEEPQSCPMWQVLLAVFVAASICGVESSKEFADCGSTVLKPVKLELDPDPAEVCVQQNQLRTAAAAARLQHPTESLFPSLGQPTAGIHRDDGGQQASHWW
jgi:hypothetical protein